MADQHEALGRVYEIGGPEQMTYLRDARRSPRRSSTGHRVPIVRVPVLTPRLSSYWLAFVTDVDVTTGRNLIDSMGTEVVVTDHSIRDLVPGEPLRYDEAVRRALEDDDDAEPVDRSSGWSAEEGGEHEQHRRPDQTTWVMIGARMPPVARRSRPTRAPSSSAAKAEHEVAGGQGRGGVGRRS